MTDWIDEGHVADAEKQLLELVRGKDADNFTLTITSSDGKWTVITEMMDPPGKSTGQGSSFAQAWHEQDPWWGDKR